MQQLPTCVILDQDDTGLELTSPADGVDFDLNGDGARERVGWIRSQSQDGFLAIDVNKNGTIDNGTELVGSGLKHPKLEKKMNGFDALLYLQNVTTGADGRPTVEVNSQLDAGDAAYQEFRVWIDANHNGRSEREELSTLPQAGITALSPAYRRAPESGTYAPGTTLGNPNGNVVVFYERYFFTKVVPGAPRRTAFEVRLQRK